MAIATFTLIVQSCKKVELPTIIISRVININTYSATGEGIIIEPGSAEVIDRGICWSPEHIPTIDDNRSYDSNIKNVYSRGSLINLIPGKK